MSITDILYYVIIFVYVQGQLILSTELWTKSKKYSSSSGAKRVIDINLILSYLIILAQLLMFSQPTDIKSK